MPLVPFHFTLVQNIKRDPFEQAVGLQQKSAMALGGSLGAPMSAWQYDFNLLPIGQQLWYKHLMTYKEFPPLQAPETYNLDGILKMVESPVARAIDAMRRTRCHRRGGPQGPPGHSQPRCCYVDFLNTGPAVAATLRRQISRVDAIRRVSNLTITDLVTSDGAVVGAVGLDTASGEPVTIAAKATIIATGGLTRLYRRNSASANMGGERNVLQHRIGKDLLAGQHVGIGVNSAERGQLDIAAADMGKAQQL